MNATDTLQELLRRLFRLDQPRDLDFGIHRVINRKHEHLDEYIKTELPKQVSGILEKSRNEVAETKLADLKNARAWALRDLGPDGINSDGNLAESAYAKIPAGANFLRVQQDALHLKSAEEMREEIHDHLANFFARYECGGGDIIPQRRHSVRNRYALPHNGEEVLLHWANRDQYYIKSAAYHPAIAFKADGKRFKFQIAEARDIPRDNNKDTGRFLIPDIDKIAPDQHGDIVIPFAFRALDKKEQKRRAEAANGENGNGGKVQRGILTEAMGDLEKAAAKNPDLRPLLKLHIGEPQDTNKPQKSVFAVHAARFVRRNTADFFIHRNLRKFLAEELDLYLKCEVLNADELIGLNGLAVSARMVVFRAVREIAVNIADKLAEWENLQKTLWEKKKFVLQTEYCIAVGRIPDAEKSGILDAIAKCDMQWAEWETLGINCGKKRKDYLRQNPSLPIDTANFPPEFKDLLLAQFPDIDDATDGVLIHGENWQALNLMQEMYRGRVKCVYIDPPYNTGGDGFLYRDQYQHSSWLSMMADRFSLARRFVFQNGVVFVSLDDNEVHRLRAMMSAEFGEDNFVALLPTVMNLKGNQDEFGFAGTHEYTMVFAKDKEGLSLGEFEIVDEELTKWEEDEWGLFKKGAALKGTGANATKEKRPNLHFPLYIGECDGNLVARTERNSDSDMEILPITDGDEMTWRWEKKKFNREPHNVIVERVNRDGYVIYKKQRPSLGDLPTKKPKTLFYKPEYSSGNGTQQLRALFGVNRIYANPKPLRLIGDFIEIGGERGGIVFDYFAGSGTTAHAVIDMNREDNGRRKFVLVDAGDHFNTVLLPRVKKVIYSPEWQDGKPSRQATTEELEHGPRLVKYQRIESYEDTLENIEFAGPDEEKQGELELAERLTKIMPRYELEWETRGCATRLSESGLDSPFSYGLELAGDDEMRTESVDLPETFAYLAGLRVRTRHIAMDGERRYLVQRGLCGGRETAVIWRDTAGWKQADYDREAEFIKKSGIVEGAGWILVNGNSSLPQAESLNPIFGGAMFSEEEVE